MSYSGQYFGVYFGGWLGLALSVLGSDILPEWIYVTTLSESTPVTYLKPLVYALVPGGEVAVTSIPELFHLIQEKEGVYAVRVADQVWVCEDLSMEWVLQLLQSIAVQEESQ